MNYITPSEVKQIKDLAFRAWNAEHQDKVANNRERLLVLELVNETAGELLRCYAEVDTHVGYQQQNLTRILTCKGAQGTMGNACGVMQNVQTLEILNGKIEVLMQTLLRFNRAFKFVEIK
jgi:hypothetical protein